MGQPQQHGEPQMKPSQREQPVAQVSTCSDLSMWPEAMFDLKHGDLLVTQVAGNVVDEDIVARLEYGTVHLEVMAYWRAAARLSPCPKLPEPDV
jgi:carbonic anhydrase